MGFTSMAFEFYLSELAHLVSDEVQRLLNAFFLSFFVSVNLSYNELGITVRTTRSMMSPSRDSSIMLIPLAFFVDNSSMWAIHFDVCSSSSFGSSSVVVNSAMKSANA
uniref:Uncharacterized protein n=1 Tax=Fagus sylvatica TaxID=28930 RepID=A0A2N9E6T9_FAGSY